MALTDDEKQKWIEGAEEFGDAIENRSLCPVMAEGEIDVTVSFPAVKYDKDPSVYSSAKPEGFRQVFFKTFWDRIDGLSTVVEEATSDLETLKQDTTTAKDAALTATTYAERVNANLNGFTVTITDRNGTSRSVDIGFEIYRTYTSVAAMNADAANVPQGKFVVIATTSPTDPDNAKMYCKNSQGSFTFLSDLDQASAAAWSEWLNTMKPQIEAAITQAASDHTRANTDHSTASTDHTTASTDHSTAQSDHTTATSDHATSTEKANYAQLQGDYAKEWNEHPPYIGNGTNGDLNYWYLYSVSTHQYVKGPYAKGDDLDYSTMTPEEIQQLIDNIKADLIFATIAESQAAANELT